MKKMSAVWLFFIIFLPVLFIIPFARCVTYDVGVAKNDKYIWTVDKYDEMLYLRYFTEEPGFEEGVQKKVQITEIDERSTSWKVYYSQWDYTKNTDKFNEEPDSEKIKTVYGDPKDLSEKILTIEDMFNIWIIATPYTNYLDEFVKNFDNELIMVSYDDDILSAKYGLSHIEYTLRIKYALEGVAEQIQYVDNDENVFVEINLSREVGIPGYNPLILLAAIFASISLIYLSKKSILRVSN